MPRLADIGWDQRGRYHVARASRRVSIFWHSVLGGGLEEIYHTNANLWSIAQAQRITANTDRRGSIADDRSLICAHWADPTSLELLDLIVERAPNLPLLAIVTFRPDSRRLGSAARGDADQSQSPAA
jgi:hypothetical protein